MIKKKQKTAFLEKQSQFTICQRTCLVLCFYTASFRRRLIDFAAKITSGGRNIILNVTREIYETFKIEKLWQKCLSPPVIQYE